MYGIYANIWGIFMVNGTPYMAYMDPMGNNLGYKTYMNLDEKISYANFEDIVMISINHHQLSFPTADEQCQSWIACKRTNSSLGNVEIPIDTKRPKDSCG